MGKRQGEPFAKASKIPSCDGRSVGQMMPAILENRSARPGPAWQSFRPGPVCSSPLRVGLCQGHRITAHGYLEVPSVAACPAALHRPAVPCPLMLVTRRPCLNFNECDFFSLLSFPWNSSLINSHSESKTLTWIEWSSLDFLILFIRSDFSYADP